MKKKSFKKGLVWTYYGHPRPIMATLAKNVWKPCFQNCLSYSCNNLIQIKMCNDVFNLKFDFMLGVAGFRACLGYFGILWP